MGFSFSHLLDPFFHILFWKEEKKKCLYLLITIIICFFFFNLSLSFNYKFLFASIIRLFLLLCPLTLLSARQWHPIGDSAIIFIFPLNCSLFFGFFVFVFFLDLLLDSEFVLFDSQKKHKNLIAIFSSSFVGYI